MPILIVVNNPKNWAWHIPGVEVVSARSYLTEPQYSELRNAKVFNLSRDYAYQTLGYYVSLLAEARGHKPMPSVNTIQDLKSWPLVRFVSEDLEQLIQKSLNPIQSNEFTLSIFFGRSMAHRHASLSLSLFNAFPAPLLQARFLRKGKKWQLQSLRPIGAKEIPYEHREFMTAMAEQYFAGARRRTRKRTAVRYDMAILYDPTELISNPSNDRAINKFIRAGEAIGLRSEVITKDDYGRLAEFDALFIRQTTNVNHYTYRFARRAQAEGLVVVDDPESILKCTNKVYLAELLHRMKIPAPKTLILKKNRLAPILGELGFPCILKQPDSAFSQGVVKVETESEFVLESTRLLEKSDLIIAQEFLPTDFDWRVGIFDRQILYACKYFMAYRHWQVVHRGSTGKVREGSGKAVPLEDVPSYVLKTALKAANRIGNGLYGVDLKQIGNKCYVIEVNDNPSIDAGVEDTVLKDELYRKIMQIFLDRIEKRKAIQHPENGDHLKF
jgi:glutathione synthase/RimK-type ligase-like ATP-grasp enzyme